jgi:hypothetical protein
MTSDDTFQVTALAAARTATRTGRPRSGVTTTRTVLPELLQAALRAAGDDASRLDIISPNEIIIRNRGKGGRS